MTISKLPFKVRVPCIPHGPSPRNRRCQVEEQKQHVQQLQQVGEIPSCIIPWHLSKVLNPTCLAKSESAKRRTHYNRTSILLQDVAGQTGQIFTSMGSGWFRSPQQLLEWAPRYVDEKRIKKGFPIKVRWKSIPNYSDATAIAPKLNTGRLHLMSHLM